MPELLLPPRVRAEIQKEKNVAERERRKALADRLLDFDDPVCREWASVLADMDPFLRLGRARPQAFEPGMAVKPGYYHWCRDNPGAPMSIEPITGPDGVSFAEPDSGFLRELQANDLRNPYVWRALIERGASREAEVVAARDAGRVERQSEMLDRWKAVSETSVSMIPGWSQNHRGRRGRKR